MSGDFVPDWFWDAIESTRPDLSALEAWLVARPKETIARFAFVYEEAALEVGDYAEGVLVDGVVWSEDGTEDLCKWVVSRGRTYWTALVSGEVPLSAAAHAYAAGLDRWDTNLSDPAHRGYASPGGIAYGVYWARFGEELGDLIDDPDYEP